MNESKTLCKEGLQLLIEARDLINGVIERNNKEQNKEIIKEQVNISPWQKPEIRAKIEEYRHRPEVLAHRRIYAKMWYYKHKSDILKQTF